MFCIQFFFRRFRHFCVFFVLFCFCSSCLKIFKEIQFFNVAFYINQSSNEKMYNNNWCAFETMTWNVKFIATIIIILISKSNSKKITKTSNRNNILTKVQRNIKCVFFHQLNSIRRIFDSKIVFFCCHWSRFRLRVYADKIYFTIKFFSNNCYHLQRFSLQLNARNNEF